MTQHYSETIQIILADVEDHLEKNPDLDHAFLEEIKEMLQEGKLGSGARITMAVSKLEETSHEP